MSIDGVAIGGRGIIEILSKNQRLTLLYIRIWRSWQENSLNIFFESMLDALAL